MDDSTTEKLKSLNISKASNLETIIGVLRERSNFYTAENDRMDAVKKKLGIEKDLMSPEAQKALDTLVVVQEKFETTQPTAEALALSYVDRQRKQGNYISKVKACIKLFTSLNNVLATDIKTAQRQLTNSQKKLTGIPSDEVKVLQNKIGRYERDLLKLEGKHPWLKNPDFNLETYAKQMNTLVALQQEQLKLTEELSHYQGLKPNIAEAQKQLADVKLEHSTLVNKMLNECSKNN